MHGTFAFRPALVCMVLTALVLAVFVAPAASESPPATKSVAATVNGQPIYEVTVRRALERVPPARRAEIRTTILDHLVNNMLVDQMLREAGWKVKTSEVDRRIAAMKAELKQLGRDFDKMLAGMKIQEAEMREHIATDLRWYKYASAQATDRTLLKLFKADKEAFDGTKVKARHILYSASTPDAARAARKKLVTTRAAIEKEVNAALAKLPASTTREDREKERARLLSDSFSKYAREKSDCPSKANGGQLGAFPKTGFMVAPFAKAAFALKTNQMSDVVETPFGLHLILVTERKPGRQVELKDVREQVKQAYLDRLHERLAAKLRLQAKIKINPAPK